MSENLVNSGGNQVRTSPTLATAEIPSTDNATASTNGTNALLLNNRAGNNSQSPVSYPPGLTRNEKRTFRQEHLMNRNRDMGAVLSSGGSNQSPQTKISAGHSDTASGGRPRDRRSTSVQHRLGINGQPNHGHPIKRQRSNEQNSPANRSKPKRRDPKNTPEVRPGTSFSNVVVDSYLVMAIIIAPSNGVMIPCTRESFAAIFRALNELIFEDMDKGAIRP